MSDQSIAAIARRLAEALFDVAYSRSQEDKKRVAQLHVELCTAVKHETTETPVQT
jgi:F0F1-type ATP synthase delta subunit